MINKYKPRFIFSFLINIILIAILFARYGVQSPVFKYFSFFSGHVEHVYTPEEIAKFDKFMGPHLPPDFPPLNIFYHDFIQQDETFSQSIMKYQGINHVDVENIVQALTGYFDFRNCRTGHSYIVEMSPDKRKIISFTYKVDRLLSYKLTREAEEWKAEKLEKVTMKKIEYIEGTLEGSLFETIQKMGEKDRMILEFMKMFEYDIDFHSESRKGDTFGFLIEKEYIGDEMVRYGSLLYGYYKGENTGFKDAFRYTSPDKQLDGYYSREGKYTKKVFLRTPLDNARITSGFGQRFHPIWEKLQFHNGVDYGAPTGTPIYAVADGVVTWAGLKGPNGNLIIIKHRADLISLYAHLSRVFVKVGQRVMQRKVIGAVGSTGASTGPHLHFGLLFNGSHVNPLKKNLVPRLDIPGKYMSAFKKRVEEILKTIDEKNKNHG